MDGESPVLVIACGALAREIVALTKLNGWSALDIQCLPPELHNRPERIPAAVREAIVAGRAKYERIFVAYADCGTGGRLDQVLQAEQVERLPGAHCYEFFATSAAFAAHGRSRARHVLPDGFPRATFRQAGHRRARHRPAPGTGRRILPQLPQAHVPGASRRIRRLRAPLVLPPGDWVSSTRNISRVTATSPPASRPWRPAANIRCPGGRLHGVVDRDLVA